MPLCTFATEFEFISVSIRGSKQTNVVRENSSDSWANQQRVVRGISWVIIHNAKTAAVKLPITGHTYSPIIKFPVCPHFRGLLLARSDDSSLDLCSTQAANLTRFNIPISAYDLGGILHQLQHYYNS